MNNFKTLKNYFFYKSNLVCELENNSYANLLIKNKDTFLNERNAFVTPTYKKNITYKTINELILTEENLNTINSIVCESCNINFISLTNFNFLTHLNCSFNNINKLIIPPSLTDLKCNNNNLVELFVPKNLVFLNCSNNNLKKITFEENSNCKILLCKTNSLKELDCNNKLRFLFCQHNQLTSLNLKNVIIVNCSNNLINHIVFNINPLLKSFISLNNNFKKIYIPYYIKNICLYNENLETIYLNQQDYNNKTFVQSLGFINFNKIKKVDIKIFLTHINNNSVNEDDLCSICLCELDTDLYKTSCNHIFHLNCIRKIKNYLCPLCRKNIFFENLITF